MWIPSRSANPRRSEGRAENQPPPDYIGGNIRAPFGHDDHAGHPVEDYVVSQVGLRLLENGLQLLLDFLESISLSLLPLSLLVFGVATSLGHGLFETLAQFRLLPRRH